MLKSAARTPTAEVYLHVQVGNDDAVEFYKRFDFEVGETVKDYYKRIEPPDVVLAKRPPFTTDS